MYVRVTGRIEDKRKTVQLENGCRKTATLKGQEVALNDSSGRFK